MTIVFRRNRRTRRMLTGAAAALVTVTAAVAMADVPHGFAAGETLRADDLNANFSALDQRLGALEAATVPAGAVLAFDLDACPTGFTPYAPAAGRSIVGVNDGVDPQLSTRTRGDQLGEESHAMTTEEMPSHRHDLSIFGAVGPFDNDDTGLKASGGSEVPTTFGSEQSELAGGGVAFTNFQPSIVLLYCRRS